MKNNFFNLLAFTLLLTSVACSNPETENFADVTQNESLSLDVTSRGNAEGEDKEDRMFLLVRKWVVESGSAYVELKIDGSFEGNLNTESVVYGKWELSEDQKTLKLKSNEGEEGKGRTFQAIYTVAEMSFDTLKLKDEKGKETSFNASK
jgi:hypothetical protein